MTSSTISVVCSAFNAAGNLHAALDSVLSQQGVTLELIVVNDGSVDSTRTILDQYAIADSRVRAIHQENQGLTRALITGCAAAQGEYIARLDSDDVCLPSRLQKQAALLDCHPEVSFVSCWSRAIGPGGEALFETHRPADIDDATYGLRHQRMGPTTHGSVMFRTKQYHDVGGYRHQFYFAQDSDLWLRLVEAGKIAYVPEVLYEFNVAPASISSRHREIQHALGELAHCCKEARYHGASETSYLERAAFLRPGLTTAVKTDLVAGDYFIATCLLKRQDGRARRYFLQALAKRPWMLRAWYGLALTLLRQRSVRVRSPKNNSSLVK